MILDNYVEGLQNAHYEETYFKWKEEYGNVNQQHEKLLDAILYTFENPETWPMTDTERIEFLKGLYIQAKRLRQMKFWQVKFDR